MRKLGGITLLAVVALTACAAPVPSSAPRRTPTITAEQSAKWTTKSGDSIDPASISFKDAEVAAFAAAAKNIRGYEKESSASLAVIGRHLCEHYAAGFTTDDLRQTGESLASLGEAAKATVCAK
jgi:hypothetical protein